MLDPEVDEAARKEFADTTRTRVESGGTLLSDSAWGTRKMAYEIDNHAEADYRYYRFRSEPPLLKELDHNLKIADGVLRFRVFKVDPRSPVVVPPELSTLVRDRDDRDSDDSHDRSERSARR